MKCFRHPQADAVGTCKHCSKGTCSECSKDTGIGLVCSPQCEVEVRSLKAIMDRNKQAFALVAKAHGRNSALLLLFGIAFVAFSPIERTDPFIFPFLLSTGAIILTGAIFSFLMARRYAKSSGTQA
jgi:hypothetical protein